MQLKTKKIIAREGLIILGIIGISFFVFFISSAIPKPKLIEKDYYAEEIEGKPPTLTSEQFDKAKKAGFTSNAITSFEQRRQSENFYKIRNNISTIGFLILFSGYPFYLLIRFILWAIKTLMEK